MANLVATPDASNTQFRYIIETTTGETPATPTLIEWRVAGEGVQPNIQDVESQELSNDPNIISAPRTLEAPGGDVNYELSWAEQDFAMLSVLRAAKTTLISLSADVNMAVVGNFFTAADGDVNVVNATKTYTSAAVAFPTTIAASDLIVFAGFADAASNGTKTVVSADATNIVVTEAVGANETPAGAVTIRNDTTLPTFVSTSTDLTGINLTKGQWFRVLGFTTAANNDVFRCSATPTTTVITVDRVKVSRDSNDLSTNVLAIVTEAEGDSVTMKGQEASNGTSRSTFTLEKEFFVSDSVSIFDIMRGSEVTQMTQTVTAESIVGGSFSLNGRSFAADATSTIASSTTPSNTGEVANAVTNVSEIVIDNAIFTDGFQSINSTYNNNPRNQTKVGTKNLAGIGLDKLSGSFDAVAYFNSANAITTAHLNDTPVEMYHAIDFADGETMIISWPKVKINVLNRVAPGRGQDVTLNFGGRLIKGNATDLAYTVKVDFIPA